MELPSETSRFCLCRTRLKRYRLAVVYPSAAPFVLIWPGVGVRPRPVGPPSAVAQECLRRTNAAEHRGHTSLGRPHTSATPRQARRKPSNRALEYCTLWTGVWAWVTPADRPALQSYWLLLARWRLSCVGDRLWLDRAPKPPLWWDPRTKPRPNSTPNYWICRPS